MSVSAATNEKSEQSRRRDVTFMVPPFNEYIWTKLLVHFSLMSSFSAASVCS